MPIFSKRQQLRTVSVIDSDEDSATSTTSTLTGDFWSAGTSSIDDGNSSRGSSMPWAAEAIEQNRRDWLEIDEILYGEREFPKNERLHQELLQWKERFPHIRARGQAVGINSYNLINIKQSNNDEEVLAIDPQPRKSFLMRFQPNQLEKKLTIDSAPNRFVTNTSQLLEKCLRITPSSWSQRNASVTSGNIRNIALINSDSSGNRIKSVRSDIHRQTDFYGKSAASRGRTFSSSNVELKTPSSQSESTPSLRFRRPPPVPLIDIRSSGNWTASRSTAGRSVRVTLPPIMNPVAVGGPRSRANSNIPVNDFLRTARSVSALQDLPGRN